MSENLPCPFCGGEKQMLLAPTCTQRDAYNPNDRAFPVIRCLGCYTDVPGEDWDHRGMTAWGAWNRRAILSERTSHEAVRLPERMPDEALKAIAWLTVPDGSRAFADNNGKEEVIGFARAQEIWSALRSALSASPALEDAATLRHQCAASGIHDYDGCACSDQELLSASTQGRSE